MGKDWFDYLVGLAQIATALGVWVAFQQVKVTQKQLEITQAQLEEEQKNSKPEVFIDVTREGEFIRVVIVNVKNVPIYVKTYDLFFKDKENTERFGLTRVGLEKHFRWRSENMGVLSIGNTCQVLIPGAFFYRLFREKEEMPFLPHNLWNDIERVDLVFKIPGMSPQRISFSLSQRKHEARDTKRNQWLVEALELDRIHIDGKTERIFSWEIRKEPLVNNEIS